MARHRAPDPPPGRGPTVAVAAVIVAVLIVLASLGMPAASPPAPTRTTAPATVAAPHRSTVASTVAPRPPARRSTVAAPAPAPAPPGPGMGPGGSTAQCRDGTLVYQPHGRDRACAEHGGIARMYD